MDISGVVEGGDEVRKMVFDVMKKLLAEEEKPKRRIGFGVE